MIGRRGPLERDRLDDVGIERALRQPRDVPELAGLVLEHRDELGADGLALVLGIGHTVQRVEESVGCVDVDQVHLEVRLGRSRRPRSASPLRSRPLSTKRHVSWSPTAGGPARRRRRSPRRPRARRAPRPCRPGGGCASTADRRTTPWSSGRVQPQTSSRKLPSTACPGRVDDLGVELDADRTAAPFPMAATASCRWWPGREARRQLPHGVAVAHPHRENRRLRLHAESSPARLADRSRAWPYSRARPGTTSPPELIAPAAACRSRCPGSACRTRAGAWRAAARRPRTRSPARPRG